MPSLFGSGRVWASPARSAFRALAAALTIAVVGGVAAPAWSACLTSTLVLAAPPYTNTQCITPPVNNDGIDSTGSTYTLNNSGAITVQATTTKGVFFTDAINAQSSGDLTVINTGALSATASGTGPAAAIQAVQNVTGPTGTVTVTNGGAITLLATDGNLAAGIAAEANQIASVTNNSTITGTTDSTSQLVGISATAGSFSCTGATCTSASSNVVSNVTNNGTINLNGPNTIGVFINTTGAGSSVNNITNNGALIVNGTDSTAISGFAELTPATCPIVSCTFTFGPVNIANAGLIQAGSGAFLFFSPFFINNPTNLVTNTGVLDGQFRDPALSSSTFTETDLTNAGLFYISYPGAGLAQIIDGKFTQTASGILGLRINAAGQSDFLTARSVNLGGTLLAIMQPGNYANVTNYLGVVQSTAAITTQFATVETNSAFFLASATYNTNTVDLTVTREQFGLVPGLTPNERAVGNALEAGFEAGASSGPGGSIYTALFGLPSLQQAGFAYDQLSGEIHASTQSVMLDQSFYAREAMLSRMRQFGFGGTAGALISLGSGGPALAYAEPNGSDGTLALGYAAGGGGSAFPVKAPPAARTEPDLVYWAQGVAAWGRLGSDGNAATVTDTLGGFFSGLDKRFGDWRAGLMLGYTGAGASLPARGSSANIDTAHLGAYAGTGWGAWHLRTGGEFAWSELSTDRSITFPGFMDTATSHYGADEGQVFGELGYGMSFGRIAAEAFGGLAGVTLHTDSFTETGGVAALNGAADNDDVGYSTLGARAATTFDWGGMALTPRVSAAWQHAFGDVTPTAALSFQTIGTGFTVAGVPIARDAALVDAGADLALNHYATIGIAYVGQIAGRDQDNSVNGTFRLKF